MTTPFVLVIEDDKNLALIFSIVLKSSGYNAEMVRDGQMALNRLNEIIPDIVMLDLHLPTVPGTEILRFIRANPKLSGTRVMVVTADTIVGNQIRDMADLVLVKPVSIHQLRPLLAQLL